MFVVSNNLAGGCGVEVFAVFGVACSYGVFVLFLCVGVSFEDFANFVHFC